MSGKSEAKLGTKEGPRLSIFKTFKTKRSELTGEAHRQRSILVALATMTNPADRTRTAISQKIGGGEAWKNIYSGVFRDIDEILVPLGIVQEEGRLPLKRGPKALQEMGIPYYQLTPKGSLVCLAIGEAREGRVEELLSALEPEQHQDVVLKLAGAAPRFTYSLFERYVKAYCEGEMEELLPLDLAKLGSTSDESVLILREFLDGFMRMSKTERDTAVSFLDCVCPKNQH